MKKLLLMMLIAVPLWGQAPVLSPALPTANGGGTINFSCTSNCGSGGSWSVSGAGSINSGSGVYTAPASVTAKNQLGGYQFLPNNHIFNTDISGLSASAITGAAGNFNLLPAFPLNYVTNSTTTDSMVFFYTTGNNGTYFAPSQNSGLSGLIESGWYEARHTVPGVTNTDHHYLKANSDNGHYEEQYQYYPVGNGAGEGCPLCNSQSGVKYNSTDYNAPAGGATIDAAGLYVMPLMLRRQEFDTACAGGAGTGTLNHALRLTLPSGYISNTFIWPATSVSPGGGTHAYGERFRLKSSFSEVGFSACAKLILHQLKNYGVLISDIGFNWQANIEYGPWSSADIGYFAEINGASIPDSSFEKVDESSLEITASSWEANTNRETVSYTSSSGTTTVDVALIGITVGMLQDAVDIMAGSPNIQLLAKIQGTSNSSLTWTLSSAVGSVTSSGLYTPPATATGVTVLTVTATSVADSSVSASSILRVWPHVAAYVLPSFASGSDYTDSGGHIWRSGAGIGINSQQAQLGCCADYSGMYTGSTTDNELWDHTQTSSLTNLVDNHIYWFVPAGTYTVTFHAIAPFAVASNQANVNFIAQGTTRASNVDPAASGVGQYGPYTRTDNLTVGCDNLLLYDDQMFNDGGFNQISSFSVIQNTNTQSSCGGSVVGGAGAGMMR